MKLPRIAVITPSFNQVRFLERTIQSVLDQNYPELEYIIVDGGSTDGSVDLIRKYSDRLSWWVSEEDAGQSAAINKGLRRATGEILGWLNSDDTLASGALHAIAAAYSRRPDVELLYGHTCQIDENDVVTRRLCAVPTNAGELMRYNANIFSQPGTTWRRQLQERIGLLDESLHCAMDADYWIRAAKAGVLGFEPRHFGNLRVYGETKTATRAERFRVEYAMLAERYGATPVAGWQRLQFRLRRLGRIAFSPKTLVFRSMGPR